MPVSFERPVQPAPVPKWLSLSYFLTDPPKVFVDVSGGSPAQPRM